MGNQNYISAQEEREKVDIRISRLLSFAKSLDTQELLDLQRPLVMMERYLKTERNSIK